MSTSSSSSPSMMIRGERGEEEGRSVVFSDHLLSGYGFQPTDVEILDHYLRSRITSNSSAAVPSYLIQEFDCYSMEPWNLPCDSFRYQNEEKDMHFFTRSRSRRAGRIAGCGFWQRNGRDSLIKVESRLIGHKTHLVFMMLKGKEEEKKIKTDWIMHEFHLKSPSGTTKFDDLVLCRIRMKRSNNCCREREEDDTDAANTAYASSVAEVEEEEEPNQRLVKMKRAKEHGSMADNNESGTSNSGPTSSSSSSSSSGSSTPQLVSREQPEGITSIDSGWL